MMFSSVTINWRMPFSRARSTCSAIRPLAMRACRSSRGDPFTGTMPENSPLRVRIGPQKQTACASSAAALARR